MDWDIHHGNGIQDLTYDDENIFYFSIHRCIYPFTGRYDETGTGDAVGTNCNIIWNDSVGNEEYAEAFCSLVMPAIASFEPDLVLISSGFDAAEGDRIGDCSLTPAMYYAMTNALLVAAGRETPIVAVLEGGYNLDVIAECAEGIALALLDEPWKDDHTHYESKTFWSTKSILPVTSSQILQHSNPFSLRRFLGKKPLKIHAFRSINRTAEALQRAECRIGCFDGQQRKDTR